MDASVGIGEVSGLHGGVNLAGAFDLLRGERVYHRHPMKSCIATRPRNRNAVMMSICRAVPALLMVMAPLPVSAAEPAPIGSQMMAYPAKGQSEKQQEVEQFRCHEQAVKLSKYNPRTAYAYIDNRYGSESDGPGQRGGLFGRSEKMDTGAGAGLGVVVGSAAGGPIGGAVVGAMAGTALGKSRQAGQARRQEDFDAKRQTARSERERTMARRQQVYERSWTECMQAMGYTTR